MSQIKKKNKNKEMLEKQREMLNNRKKGNLYNQLIQKSMKSVVNLNIDELFPAPNHINFFPQISEEKMLEMMLSIIANGLLNPIIVWKQKDKYMILSGHNRVIAYKRIMHQYKNEPGFDKEKYETIPSIIYEENEIDEDKAKEIAIDTNTLQRPPEEYKKLGPMIIKNKLEIVRRRKDIKGRTIDLLAKELGVSSTKVYEDHTIATKIIPELRELFFKEKIVKKSLLRFAWFDKDIQKYMYSKYKDKLDNDRINRLRKGMNREEIDECFTEEVIKKTLVSTSIPEPLVKEFKIMAKLWLKEKQANMK